MGDRFDRNRAWLVAAWICGCGAVEASDTSDPPDAVAGDGSDVDAAPDAALADSPVVDAPPSEAGADAAFDAAPPIGAFDLTFTSVTADVGPVDYPPDAPETNARLDLRLENGQNVAFVSPLGLEPGAFAVSTQGAMVTLDGSVAIGALNACGYGNSLTWEQIRFPIDASGVPLGTFEASGTKLSIAPKVGGSVLTVVGEGKITADARAPSLALAPSKYPSGSLPWDPIEIVASEPVDGTLLQAALSVPGSSAGFELVAEDPPASTLGSRRVRAMLASWSGMSTLAIAAKPIGDAAGNTAPPWSQSLGIFELGSAAAHLAFDAPMGAVFGGGQWVDASTQPFCDTDGCAQTASYIQYFAPTGVAGLLAAPTKSQLTVRYRQVIESTVPALASLALTLELAAPGTAPVSFTLPGQVTTEIDGKFVTDWITTTVALPPALASAPEIGFAIVPLPDPAPCNLPFGFVYTTVLVDDVAVQ